MKSSIALLGTLIVLALVGVHSAEGPIREYALYEHGALVLTVPESWLQKVDRPRADLPPTIELTPDRAQSIRLMITPLWNMTGDPAALSIEKVRGMVDGDRRGLQSQAVEKEPVLESIEGGSARGYFFRATDRAPKPGEHKYLIRAGLLVGDLILSATILSHARESEALDQAMEILKSARQRTP